MIANPIATGTFPIVTAYILRQDSAINSEPLKNERAPNLRVNTICAMRVQTQNAKIPNHEVLLHLF